MNRLAIFAYILLCGIFSGCSSMQVVTEDDKLQEIGRQIPDGWRVIYTDTPFAGFCGWTDIPNKRIYTVRDSITLEHELLCHAIGGYGHDNCPERLMMKGC